MGVREPGPCPGAVGATGREHRSDPWERLRAARAQADTEVGLGVCQGLCFMGSDSSACPQGPLNSMCKAERGDMAWRAWEQQQLGGGGVGW